MQFWSNEMFLEPDGSLFSDQEIIHVDLIVCRDVEQHQFQDIILIGVLLWYDRFHHAGELFLFGSFTEELTVVCVPVTVFRSNAFGKLSIKY